MQTIVKIYHRENGVPGYRMMNYYLSSFGINRSNLTIHHYMNALGLRSIVHRKSSIYCQGMTSNVFPNIINRKFDVKQPNKVWCIDFTYLPCSNGIMRYNCTIIDLCGREAIATLDSDRIDTELTKNTLKIALKRRKPLKGVILHSDQGSQFTAMIFTEFCSKYHIQQSMSQAGCPYDNAVMERFYNTLKHEFYHIFQFSSISVLDQGV